MNKKTTGGSLIKVIRKRCLDCGEGTAQAVKQCDFNDCPLFAYRLGKSPAHKKLWQDRHPAHLFAKKVGATGQENSKERQTSDTLVPQDNKR